jgi:hypothetical protein
LSDVPKAGEDADCGPTDGNAVVRKTKRRHSPQDQSRGICPQTFSKDPALNFIISLIFGENSTSACEKEVAQNFLVRVRCTRT